MKKYIYAIVILICFTAIFLLNNNSKSNYKEDSKVHKVKFGIYEGDTSLLSIIAEKKGFFKDENLDIEIKRYPTGYHAMTAMLNGEVDYSNATEFVASKYSFTNANFKILGSMAVANINGAVAKKSKGINTPLDMKNHRIGTTIGTVAEYYTGVFLDYNKLSTDDISIINVPFNERLEVLEKDEVDVLFAWEPIIYQLRKKYKEDINFFPMPLEFEFYFLILSDKEFHKNNSIISSKILKSLYRAQNYIKENPKEFKTFVKNYFNFDDEYITYILNKHKFEVTFPYVLTSVMNNQFKWLKKNNLVEGKSVKISNLYDSSILKSIDSISVTILE